MLAAKVLLLLALLSAVCEVGAQLSDGVLEDRAALLSLKVGCSSFGRARLASWRSSGSPCTPKPWPHVLCTKGRVVALNLSGLSVVGTLPSNLRLASQLAYLNLDGNRFTGSIPDAWAGKNSFTGLKALNLAGNDLTGTLPSWNRAGAWRSLEHVDLSENNFYGGLPNSWLTKARPMRKVRYLDLSNNNLGTTDGSTPATQQSDWCPPEGALPAGSGWCPGGLPLADTAPSLVTLDLSNNGFVGQLPLQWPKIFRRVEYVLLSFNDLSAVDTSGNPVASVLPAAWTSEQMRGFPALSMLTLYPGNDYLCSVPTVEGGFEDINIDATYQVVGDGGEAYTDTNPRACPSAFAGDAPVEAAPVLTFAGAAQADTTVSWSYAEVVPAYIWGFKVTLWGQATASGLWAPFRDWNAVLLRTYVLGGDGFGQPVGSSTDVADQGLSFSGGTWTLAFKDIRTERLSSPVWNVTTADISNFRADVTVVFLDLVESTTMGGTPAANPVISR